MIKLSKNTKLLLDGPIQDRHYDTIIMDDIYKEPQMPRVKRLKNKPSTRVNEIYVDPKVVEDLRVQAAAPPVENKYDVEPTNFHARRTVSHGANKLIEA